MTKNPVTLGVILFIITMLVFFIVYYFFGGADFFDTSMKVNAFILPLFYVSFAFMSVRYFWKNNNKINFKEAFRRAFIPMFVGGFFSMLSIFSFLNFVDPGAKDLLNYQYVQRQKSELDNEYHKAKQIIKDQKEKEELEKNYRNRLESFSEKNVAGKDMLTFTHFSAYFGAVLLFYIVISAFLGAFFRSRNSL